MCRVFNTIGCLNVIQQHLVSNNLDEFTSLDELIIFQKDYHFKEQQIISDHTLLIQQEKTTLERDIANLTETTSSTKLKLKERLQQRLDNLNQQIEHLAIPDSRIVSNLKDYWVNLVIWIKIWFSQGHFHFKTIILTWQSNKLLSKKTNRFNYITTHFNEALKHSSSSESISLQRKNSVIKEINKSIYGALGEQKVVNVLENLSDDYVLINDFTCSFDPPIYNTQDKGYIKSIQIDHILISPAGIFIIETKNWSKYSFEKLYLFSPVQQVKRTNYALYKIITTDMRKSNWDFTRKHWGDRKIPIRNVVIFTNEKPTEEFQFVKILGLNQVLGYIKYFKPCFSSKETQVIADFLLKTSHQKKTISKLNI
jgi:hypothetical protein